MGYYLYMHPMFNNRALLSLALVGESTHLRLATSRAGVYQETKVFSSSLNIIAIFVNRYLTCVGIPITCYWKKGLQLHKLKIPYRNSVKIVML